MEFIIELSHQPISCALELLLFLLIHFLSLLEAPISQSLTNVDFFVQIPFIIRINYEIHSMASLFFGGWNFLWLRLYNLRGSVKNIFWFYFHFFFYFVTVVPAAILVFIVLNLHRKLFSKRFLLLLFLVFLFFNLDKYIVSATYITKRCDLVHIGFSINPVVFHFFFSRSIASGSVFIFGSRFVFVWNMWFIQALLPLTHINKI